MIELEEQLVSDEIHDIVSWRPHFLVRHGSIICLLVLAGIFALSFLIRYPDTIPGQATLQARNAPKAVRANTGGKLVRLLASNDQPAARGQMLAYIESTADADEVLRLHDWILSAMQPGVQNDTTYTTLLPPLRNLGELQTAFQQFAAQWNQLEQLSTGGYYPRKSEAIKKDLNDLATIRTQTMAQFHLLEKGRELGRNEYLAYDSLARDRVIAPLELNAYKSKLLAQEQGLHQAQAQIAGNEVSSRGKQKELMDLEQTMANERAQCRSALLALKSSVEEWMHRYILTAPEAGRVIFAAPWQENETVSSGQDLFYVLPDNSGYDASIMVAQHGLGKIKKGQRIILDVDGYPHEEYGHLNAVVSEIGMMPSRRDSFLVKATLVQGLVTHSGQTLTFRTGLTAQARIVTDEKRLSSRMAGAITRLF